MHDRKDHGISSSEVHRSARQRGDKFLTIFKKSLLKCGSHANLCMQAWIKP